MADRELEGELRKTGRWMRRLTGYSPTTGHAEAGWAVEMPWGEACDVGLRFKQDAIYTVNGDELSVTLCDHRCDGAMPSSRICGQTRFTCHSIRRALQNCPRAIIRVQLIKCLLYPDNAMPPLNILIALCTAMPLSSRSLSQTP